VDKAPAPVRILIVEDEFIVAEDLARMLKSLGYEVAGPAATAEKALNIIATSNPDLVLMDIALKGGRDGIDAAAEIRRTSNKPVIFVTALGDPGTLQRAKRSEPYGFLYKPFEQRDIYAAIETALNRHSLEKALRESEERNCRAAEELQRLASHLESVRESERARIARQLHDELGQALTAIKMDIAWLLKRFPAADTAMARRAEGLSGLIDDALRTVRRLSQEMRPGILDDLGLKAALEWLCSDFAERTSITCGLDARLDEKRLTQDQATAFFRIMQEALTNVSRHAGAKSVRVRLQETGGEVRLEVNDDGRGITSSQTSGKGTLGLIGIRERVLALNGRLDIQGRPGGGTTLTIALPLAAEEPKA